VLCLALKVAKKAKFNFQSSTALAFLATVEKQTHCQKPEILILIFIFKGSQEGFAVAFQLYSTFLIIQRSQRFMDFTFVV
jgi:hypothetical protein